MAETPLDGSRLAVFLDFDGTISTLDVGRYLLARAAQPEWWDLHLQYERGEIGSRDCISGQWALLTGSEGALRAVAREVPLDPGFERLVHSLRDHGAEVAVLSDGFGFYVHEICDPLGLDVYTNAADFDDARVLRFPNEDPTCACAICGVCKQAPIRDAQARGRTTVLVGDGASDRQAALVADIVFAKDELADWCDASGLGFTRFETLDDVRRTLGSWS
jgi:2,3-diketo-5-methylthio-1-phosphopentane phosphatase